MSDQHWPAVVFFLTRGPQTVSDLVGLTGASEDAIRRNVDRLHEEGLVKPREKRKGKNGAPPVVWEWAV